MNPERVEESQIRINEECAKISMREKSELQKYEIKLRMKAQIEEIKKGQYEMVSINEDGEVWVQLINAFLQNHERKICNFRYPQIISFSRASNTNEIIYALIFELDKKDKCCFLDKEKCGNTNYLLKKIRSEGGEFVAKNETAKKNLASQLLSVLLRSVSEESCVPDDPGWYVDENDKVRFFTGKMTWKEIKRCSK